MMVKNKNSNNFLVLGSAILIFIAINILQISFKKPVINISKQESALNINQNFLKFFSMGNKRLISNIIWIQTLLESDVEHYSKKDKNSWMYHRFLSIAELDPIFYENYLWGGMYLSIVKDDIFGAADIYERGLKLYPDDYNLNFNAGYNYVIEIGENEKGLKLLDKIKNHPRAPVFLPSLVEKVRYEITSDASTALAFLNESLLLANEASIQKKIKNDIYAIQAEIDLKCLNELKNKSCKKFDIDGNPYSQNSDGTWTSVKKFKKFKIIRKK